MKRPTRLGAILFIATMIASSLPLLGASSASADSGCWDYKRTERRFAHKANRARSRRGISKLSIDPELSKAARKHTTEMVRNRRLYHTPSRALRHRVTRWIVLGENVGVGGTVSSLHRAFMNSRVHKDNILYRPYRHVGIGVRKARGRMWVTVIFESRKDPGTRLDMSC
jgi:uncharacterized protein YkwD